MSQFPVGKRTNRSKPAYGQRSHYPSQTASRREACHRKRQRPSHQPVQPPSPHPVSPTTTNTIHRFQKKKPSRQPPHPRTPPATTTASLRYDTVGSRRSPHTPPARARRTASLPSMTFQNPSICRARARGKNMHVRTKRAGPRERGLRFRLPRLFWPTYRQRAVRTADACLDAGALIGLMDGKTYTTASYSEMREKGLSGAGGRCVKEKEGVPVSTPLSAGREEGRSGRALSVERSLVHLVAKVIRSGRTPLIRRQALAGRRPRHMPRFLAQRTRKT